MPPKSKASRKRNSVVQPSADVSKKQKRGMATQNAVEALDYTKLASEIIRLQEIKTKQHDSSSEVILENENNLSESTVQGEKQSCSVAKKQTTDVANVSEKSDTMTQAAMPVVSLIDKIFSGEVNQSSETITFRPSDGIPLGATVPLKVK